MGTITSSVGLVSGINSKDIIDQLMSLEARPKNLLQERISKLNQQQMAYTDISTRLTSLRVTSSTLRRPSTFTAANAQSTNEDVLTATTTAGASVGSYQFQVARLVTTQQSVSKGFVDADNYKMKPGTLTLEMGGGELRNATPLSQLNGGDGVRRGVFRITDSSGATATIDTTSAVNLDDIVKKINTSLSVSVRATIGDQGLELTDIANGSGNLTITDLGEGKSAHDLGITTAVAASSSATSIIGKDIHGLGENLALETLNDGRGVGASSGGFDFRIATSDGSNVDVEISGMKTLGQVIEAINTTGAGKVRAEYSAGDNGIRLVDLTGSGNITVSSLNGSSAAADLGLEGSAAGGTLNGKEILAGLNTVLLSSLNGGKGLDLGSMTITDRAGGSATVDLSGARTVQDVINTINNASGVNVTVSLNAASNGLQMVDNTGAAGDLVIAEAGGGTTAEQLGLAGTFDRTVTAVRGKNLQRQWVTANSALSTYNGGKGVSPGKFTVSAANGALATIEITDADKTLADVITKINSRAIGVTASINENGDGLLLTDTSGGAGKLEVKDVTGQAAAELNIKGEATGTTIDGSFERTIEITATDTLNDVVKKINDLGTVAYASIINDGSAGAPFRLSLTSRNAGAAGRVVIDGGTTGLDTQNLVEAQDAAVFLGSAGSAEPLLVTASRNQITGVIPGVTLDLHSASDAPVTLNISRTPDMAVESIKSFVDNFNDMVTKIAELTKYDSDTNTAGLLLGDNTIQRVQAEIYSALQAVITDGGRYRVLSDVGVRVVTDAKLEFDEDKFNAAFGTDPEAVSRLFTTLEKGVGYVVESKITKLIDPVDGVLTRANKKLDSQTDQFENRISAIDKMLASKRTRLERQFAQLESVLANLQAQQSSISQISTISASSAA